MINKKNIFFFVFIFLLVLILFLQDNRLDVEVILFEKNPSEILGPDGKILPNEKAEKTYRYLYISSNGQLLDHKKYLTEHPEDAVIKKYKGDGKEDLFIFSDNLPDKKFFK